MSNYSPSTDLIQEVVGRIVEVADPDKILLFGSAARDQMHMDSDLDLLVIKSEPVHRGRLAEDIYMNMLGIKQAIDVVVATPEDIEIYRQDPYLVIHSALQSGKVIYEKSALPE